MMAILIDIVFYCFLASTIVQLLLWLSLFRKLPKNPIPQKSSFEPKPVSIIICAKNEAKNLKENLPSILQQQHAEYEVLVVNDDSTDQTAEVLESFQKKHQHLRCIHLKERDRNKYPGKKYALSKGIEASRFELLLLTDADCKANSPHWCSSMVKSLGEENNLVLGYGPNYEENTWLNSFIRFETLWTAIQYFSLARVGLPYMGVGRNILYKKEVFIKNKGFDRHQHIASGDDDLFIRDVAKGSTTTWQTHEDTFMYSAGKSTLNSFIQQKKRHISTAVHYKWSHKIILGGSTASFIAHYLLCFTLILFANKYLFPVILAFLSRQLIIFVAISSWARFFKEKRLWWKTPCLDLALLLYYLFLIPALSYGKTNKWA